MFAIGTGSAIGLRAIGWYFQPGPVLFCPQHRPDTTRDRTPGHDPDTDRGEPCSYCAADFEARYWQMLMTASTWTPP